ncbi:MAG: hypothetical protein ACI856_002281 [Kiritimatiellia bacterium]|jgi:hypothetical protein
MTTESQCFHLAFAAIDAANAEDPNREGDDGVPKALRYAERMTMALGALCPAASETLKLAARAQHIRRWVIPRATYPEGRQGYHQWRKALYQFHADQAAIVMAEAGYGAEPITTVKSLLSKEGLASNPEMQTLEDTACIVFLEHYFPAFAQQHDDAKVVSIVRKTWKKMSPRGQAAAQLLTFQEREGALIAKALEA